MFTDEHHQLTGVCLAEIDGYQVFWKFMTKHDREMTIE